MMEVPPNPVKRPEQPIFLESSYESASPSTAKVEPTESLTTTAETDRKKQHPTISKTNIIKTQKPQTTQHSATVDRTTSEEEPIIVTRVDSSITKVTSTLVSMPNNKTSSKVIDSAIQFTKNTVKTAANTVATNATVRTKPKEVFLSFQCYQLYS